VVLACVGSEERVWESVELAYLLAATRKNYLVGGKNVDFYLLSICFFVARQSTYHLSETCISGVSSVQLHENSSSGAERVMCGSDEHA